MVELEEILGRLEGDGQLQQLLAQEKMRAEVHKNNYAKLKAEFVK